MLDRLYHRFDDISHEHDVFKVETIGDGECVNSGFWSAVLPFAKLILFQLLFLESSLHGCYEFGKRSAR